MEQQPVGALRVIEGILDGFDAAAVAVGQRLECAQLARGLASRLSAAAGLLLARADADDESLRASGTSTSSWLAIRGGLSKREASGALHQAKELMGHAEVGAAAVAGRISIGQARAIGNVLSSLDDLEEAQQARAEQVMLGLAESMDSDRLSKAGPRVLSEVARERAGEVLERTLQRQAEAAQRNRSLTFGRDQNGSVTFAGSLPLIDGQAWLAILQAYTESQRRCVLEERDPARPVLTPAQRRADALLAMIAAHQGGRVAPSAGGDRPRVVVTLNYSELVAGAAGAGLVGDGDPISAGDLRQLCCDADLVPAVLGAASEVLDVGRSARLVTPAIRSALTLRDGGCVFPTCHTRPVSCEAHHVVPWWAGGETALSNLALVCHHHHGLVEPAKFGTRDQWELRIADDGIPEVIPPRRFDPERRPIRHSRFDRSPARSDHQGLDPTAA